MIAVKDCGKNLVFPKSIPRTRGCTVSTVKTIFIIILQIFTFFIAEDLIEIYRNFVICMGTIISLHFIHRICYFFEERNHFLSRYDNSLKGLLLDVFFFSNLSIIAIISIGFIFIIIAYNSYETFSTDKKIFCWIFIWLSTSLISDFLQLKECPVTNSLQISDLHGLDYGSGMAHSYFYGFLKIILPNGGTELKGLKELMMDYEGNQEIKFALYKLFILIPISLFCPTSIDTLFENIEASTNLPPIYLNRAGVKDREYKNSIYKLKTDKKKVYAAVQYATPLRTLQDIINQNNPYANVYKKYKKELVLNFYLTLRDLVTGDEDCKDCCELIYYNDLDENKKLNNVADIILKRIREIKRREKKYI